MVAIRLDEALLCRDRMKMVALFVSARLVSRHYLAILPGAGGFGVFSHHFRAILPFPGRIKTRNGNDASILFRPSHYRYPHMRAFALYSP